MTGPLALWHAEHICFRRLLELLHRELDRFHRGARPNYELMLDIVSYLREYSDQHHHPREDVAFECLAKRCPDLKLDLARLAQEHRVIACAGQKLREHIESILNGSMLARAGVEAAAATYLVYYGHHLAKEDEAVLPRKKDLCARHPTIARRRALRSGGGGGLPGQATRAPRNGLRQVRRGIKAAFEPARGVWSRTKLARRWTRLDTGATD